MKKLLALLLAATLLAGCTAQPVSPTASTGADAVSAATESRYRPGELREYNGTKLDPAIGPRDNSIKGIQHVDITGYHLALNGLVNSPKQWTLDEMTAFPAETRLVTIHCVEGWDATILWKGVLMKDLLGQAGVKAEAKTVIFHAVDGYTTSLPLAEIQSKNLMVAYGANGIALPPEMGYPLILVAEDKWGYKWARWIDRIELSADTNYKGYWETAGYDNAADYPTSSD